MQQAMQDLFPQQELPAAFPVPETPCVVTYSDILVALRRTKRHKACGLSGWTRELFSAMIYTSVAEIQIILANVFSDMVNVDVSAQEEEALKTGVLTPFYYQANGKLRPIVILEFFTKIIWHILIPRCEDSNITRTGHTFSRPGSAQLSCTAVQAALDDGRTVICTDGVECVQQSFAQDDICLYGAACTQLL